MTSRIYLFWFINLILVSLTFGLGLDYASENEISDSTTDDLDGEGRIFLPIILGNSGGGLNLTQLAALTALAAALLLPLLGLAALGLLLWAILSQQKDHGSTGYGGGYSSYSSNYRSLDVANTNWESMSILDWISVAEETYTKYDPSSTECQKKVICELYQNADAFGPPAQTFMQYFSYLKYAEVMSLPETVKEMLDNLVDAAERGGSMQKDCAEVYEDCEFSLKDIIIKYGHGIIQKDKKKDNKI